MAAVFDIMLDIGGSDDTPGSENIITNLRLRTDDANTEDQTNPIPIIASTTKYSYWRHIYLMCTTAPSTKVDNVKIYGDETMFDAGIDIYVGDETPTKTDAGSGGYADATGTPGDTGDELVATHPDITARTSFATYSAASPKSVSISEGSSQIDAIDETCDYVLIQAEIDGDTATPGEKTDETVTWRYDEI